MWKTFHISHVTSKYTLKFKFDHPVDMEYIDRSDTIKKDLYSFNIPEKYSRVSFTSYHQWSIHITVVVSNCIFIKYYHTESGIVL